MSEQISEDLIKIEEYLDVIQVRIIEPIQKTGIGRYCTATLLLLFAAIDGLGKLIHANDRALSNERIRAFLDYMGGNYSECKEELLGLRHSLIHNAINVASYMSQSEMGSDQHLERIGSVDFIFVNTSIMCNDFTKAFERLRDEFKMNEPLMLQAANRLEWREDDVEDQDLDYGPTPPPAVEFIWAR